MTLHMTGIITGQRMRSVFFWNLLFFCKHFKYPKELLYLLRIIAISFVVFFILRRSFEFLHNPIDFSIDSIELISSSGAFRRLPLSASFIAAIVVALGS